MRTMSPSSLLTRALLITGMTLAGSVPFAHAQADLIIATNAQVTFPACTEEMTYYYFFTVVDDGGGISTPTISNLEYAATAPTKIDSYDNQPFTYATFEFQVTIPRPTTATANDCFTITYEGESVSPCFDVVRPAKEVCSLDTGSIAACVHTVTGIMRAVPGTVACKAQEQRVYLALPAEEEAETMAVPQEAPAIRRQP
jgi:hypothetical protein